MRLRTIITAAFFLLFSCGIKGQYYNTGQDPAGMKWLQVKTGTFKVIYPADYGESGIDFARELDRAYKDLNVLFPGKKTLIPVIIHNHTTQANGYVSWAPKRIEIYPTPEENTIPLINNRQLALHEVTHVMQEESLKSGFSKVMSVVFGEQFTGAVTSLLPLWYMEGHAVFSETVLSGSGRGRSASFQNKFKALAIEKGSTYKYDKILNGSYRNYVPDYYQSGYQMVSWAQYKYDTQVWNKVLDFTSREPFTLNPVNISLSRSTGLRKKQLCEETFDSLKSLWEKDIINSKATKYECLNPDKEDKYINYHSPVFAGKDSIIAVRTSLSDPAKFVLLRPSEKTEKVLHVPGHMYPWHISYSGGKIYWVESQSDPRWDNRNYSVIKSRDIRTGLTHQLTFRSRYLAAAASPDGKILAATENTTENINRLVFLDAENGDVLRSADPPGNVQLQRPQWSGDGNQVTVIYITDKGEGVMAWDIKNRTWVTCLQPSFNDLQASFLRNDSLFYISSETGTNNIFLLTPGKEKKLVTSSLFGATDMALRGSDIIFSDYTSSGNNISTVSLKNNSLNGYRDIRPVSFLADRFHIEPAPADESPAKNYISEPYRKWQHLFGFHSWMPVYADIDAVRSDPTSIRPGLTLLSQNQLSTLTTSIGYEYSEDNRHVIHTKITWEGWYPVIESRVDYGYNARLQIEGDSLPASVSPGFKFRNTVYFPLNFNTGKFSQSLFLSLASTYENQYVYSKTRKLYDYGQNNLTGRFYFSNYYMYAYRDIYPRWAQIIDLSFTSAPFDKEVYGNDLAFKSTFYFPGFFKNHSIKIRFQKEKLDFAALMTTNRNDFPRSYKNIISRDLSLFSVDYSAPVAYPDLNIGQLLYMTRIRAGLFYDYAEGTGNTHLYIRDGKLTAGPAVNHSEIFSSFGAQLLADLYLLRIPFPVSAGIQSAWKSFGEAPVLEFIFNMDIYGMTIGRKRL